MSDRRCREYQTHLSHIDLNSHPTRLSSVVMTNLVTFLYAFHPLFGPPSAVHDKRERLIKCIHSQREGHAHQLEPPIEYLLSTFSDRLFAGLSGQFAICDDSMLGYNSFPQYGQALGSFFVFPDDIMETSYK